MTKMMRDKYHQPGVFVCLFPWPRYQTQMDASDCPIGFLVCFWRGCAWRLGNALDPGSKYILIFTLSLCCYMSGVLYD